MTVTEARRSLGAIVDAAGEGQIVRIVRRGRPVYVTATPPRSANRAKVSAREHRRAVARLRAIWRASARRKGESVAQALRVVRSTGYRG